MPIKSKVSLIVERATLKCISLIFNYLARILVIYLLSLICCHVRSLRSMRNYIHIHLCINLSVAQILFLAGIDKTGDPDGDVPIHCQVIAVLLHYFFLVSFMWMLMEGGILYIVLVKVFVKRKKKYILAFTLTSYGLPLIYMGLLTLPLGFTLDTYGHKSARVFL